MAERLLRGILRATLIAWPRSRRASHGEAALATAMRLVAEARAQGRLAEGREAVTEALSLLAAGLGLRRDKVMDRTRRWTMGWTTDLRYALRTLRRSPGFTSVAVTTLALGIGANAAVFSLVDRILLRPPPYERPEELVLVWNTLPGRAERVPVAGPDAAVLAERASTLRDVAFAVRGVDGSIEAESGDAAQHVRIAAVTSDFFAVLGVAPRIGRVFDERDGPGGALVDGAPAPTAVVLSEAAWRATLGADPQAVGRTVRLNGLPATVVGVMPADFMLALPPDAGIVTDVDAWIPLSVPLTAFHREDERLRDQDSDNTGAVVARLAPGAHLAVAREEVARIGAALREEFPAYAEAGLGLDVRPLHADATAHARPIMIALLAGSALVLLVACLNLATLSLARGATRRQELAVRASLGADRRRLARQLLAEGAVLAAVGLVAALVLGALATRGLAGLVPPALGAAGPAALEPRAVGFAALLATAPVLVFGLAPGLGRSSAGALVPGALRTRAVRSRGRRALVVAQVSLSVVLVLCTGLFLRTVSALQAERPGFTPEGALTFRLSLRVPERYRSPARRAEVMERLRAEIATLPGVRAVGLVGVLPLGGDRWTQPYGLPGQAESEWRANRADFRVATSGVFAAMGTRVLEGRGFTERENVHEDERVVVIDEKLAARMAPDGSALGAMLGIPVDGAPVAARVVGVVEHVRYDALDRDGREAVYVPYRQEASRDVAFVVRTEGDPAAVAPEVRRVVRAVDPRIPLHDLVTLEEYVSRAVAPRRFAFALLFVFAGLALSCVAVGLYGVVAFEVARGTRDIGVRMAVGASRTRVVREVIAGGLRLAFAGLVVGAAAGAVVSRSLRGLVYGVGAADPLVWSAVLAVVATVTLAACALPAFRASRLGPTEALRSD